MAGPSSTLTSHLQPTHSVPHLGSGEPTTLHSDSSSRSDLSTALREELDRLAARATQENPTDILQFCADYFAGRLRDERKEQQAAREQARAEEQKKQSEAAAEKERQQKQAQESLSAQQSNPHHPHQQAQTRGQSASRSPSPRGRSKRPPPSASKFRTPGYQMASPGVQPQGLFSSAYSGSGPSALEGGPASLHPDSLGEVQEEAEDNLHDLRQSPTAPSFRLTTSPPAPSPFTANSPFSPSPFSPGAGFSEMGPPTGGLMSGPPSASLNRRSPSPSSPDFPTNFQRVRRVSVSAESLVPSSANDEWTPPVFPKTPEQLARLKTAIQGNFLFTNLDDEQSAQVLSALNEKPIPAAGTRIITQGDVGDFFYVVEQGEFDVFVNSGPPVTSPTTPGAGKSPSSFGKKVTTVSPGGSFGELALMYNAPRAATIISTTPHSIVWSLDRVTFRRIIMENTFKRRRMYETFLEEVPLLSSLVAYERSKIADALNTRHFEPNQKIIQQGDPGDNFYLLEQGEAEVYLAGTEGPVKTYVKGDYFGELALLNDEPRAASVVAKTRVKVAYLGKDGFQRLLGPVTDIMRRNDPRRLSSTNSSVAAADLLH